MTQRPETNDTNNAMKEIINNSHEFLSKYSLDDLAKAFFALNLWLPNISSPIKSQLLYVTLEAVCDGLATENKLTTYAEFEAFCREIFQQLPSFAMLEDYVPEADWGDIKYYFNNNFYKIFYGGDLSNPYDFYYAFELTHRAFERQYLDFTQRSPIEEMHFCLQAQNYIIENLIQEKTDAIDDVSPGDISVPSKAFWTSVVEFMDQFHPENIFREDILNLYTKDLAESIAFPPMDTFIANAYRGRNCQYMFIKKGDRYYPVMPRKWLTVIYDSWGVLLRDNYKRIVENLNKRDPTILIGIELAKFMRERISKDDVFPLAMPVKANQKPPHNLVFTAVLAKDSLVLIYVTPPVFEVGALSQHLKGIQTKLKKSEKLVSKPPTRLGLMAEDQIVEFRPNKGDKALKPIFLIVIPSPFSEIEGRIAIPEGIQAEIMTLDQTAGIFDEIENAIELSDFFDYLATERQLNRTTGFNSDLDNFGSFKDSHGVLVRGALEPNMIMLDVNWGSEFRYRSLKDFWESFPQENFLGHPRGWTIPAEHKTTTGCILSSKSFFGYAYYQRVGDASFYINAPVHLVPYEAGMILDTTMQSLFDAIDLYQGILKKLDFTKEHFQIQVIFFPSSTVAKNGELKHLRHLVPDDNLWALDCTRLPRLGRNKFGIRVVYNDERIIAALHNTQDRSVQVSLLTDVLKQFSELYTEPNLEDVIAELEKEKVKSARFKVFEVKKSVSFPEAVSKVLPEQKEYKLADKEIAKIALGLGIEPGEYSAAEAKEKLNRLRSHIVEALNAKILTYNLVIALPLLLEKSNALIHDSWRTEEQIKASLDHEVDYERSERSLEREKEFLHWYRVYRYLIEKFVQLQPTSNAELDPSLLKELLAFIDRLLNLYASSDFINYQIYPVQVHIDRDYVVSTGDEKNDIAQMEQEYGEEQARINLGIIGNKNDIAESSLPITDYLAELDSAFKKDFGFGPGSIHSRRFSPTAAKAKDGRAA